jgi:EAL domain-containing protein (putative c-di-GMP-specific phosphodiesterase class I)
MGVQLSIDDFGTGYSSLSHLRRLPVHEVKIDRSFVTHMNQDASDATIARAIIDLGSALDLRVVAEGVEREDTLDRLCALGCDRAQGSTSGRRCRPAASPAGSSATTRCSSDPRAGQQSGRAGCSLDDHVAYAAAGRRGQQAYVGQCRVPNVVTSGGGRGGSRAGSRPDIRSRTSVGVPLSGADLTMRGTVQALGAGSRR